MASTPSPCSEVSCTDPAGHVAEAVDVEPRIDLVEDRDAVAEDRDLDRLVPLALPAGQVDVDRPVEQPLVEPDAPRFVVDRRGDGDRVAPCRHGRLDQHVLERDPRHFDGVLQRQEQPGLRPLPTWAATGDRPRRG